MNWLPSFLQCHFKIDAMDIIRQIFLRFLAAENDPQAPAQLREIGRDLPREVQPPKGKMVRRLGATLVLTVTAIL
jgi:hypothetical protein